MRKLATTIVWIALVALLALFLVANRQTVAISLDPVNAGDPAIATPKLFLWIWLMLAMLAGFALGAFAMWRSGKDRRRQARDDRRLVKELRRENEILAARSTAEPPLLKSDEAA